MPRSPLLMLLSGVLMAASAYAAAQTFPHRPIRVVVPSPAGGSPDLIARALTREIDPLLGQGFIVESYLSLYRDLLAEKCG